jgi:hypothetical protein
MTGVLAYHGSWQPKARNSTMKCIWNIQGLKMLHGKPDRMYLISILDTLDF